MPRFRKKAVVVEAILWDGSHEAAVKIKSLGEGLNLHVPPNDPDEPEFEIKTLEGTMRARIGDWIIRGVKGEVYPCKPDIFEMTYELAE